MKEKKDLSQLIALLHQQLPLVKQRYLVESLSVFGSYLHNEQHPESDLDILVTFSDPPSLLKFIELENFLSDALRVKVDLVMKDALKPHIGKQILGEAVMI